MSEKEKIARMIALHHGSQMLMGQTGEGISVSAMHHFASPERYSDRKWREYENAAKAVIEYLLEPSKP